MFCHHQILFIAVNGAPYRLRQALLIVDGDKLKTLNRISDFNLLKAPIGNNNVCCDDEIVVVITAANNDSKTHPALLLTWFCFLPTGLSCPP